MNDKPQLWIATPLKRLDKTGPITNEILDKLPKPYVASVMTLVHASNKGELPWIITLHFVGGGSVFRARNRLVSEFYEQTSRSDDRLFFIDVDLLFTPQDVVDVILHNLPICGGLYTVRAKKGHWVLNKFNGAAPTPNGLLPVMELGTGFKCFKREVFEKVLKDCPSRTVPNHSWLDCESDFDHTKRELCFFSAGPVWDDKLWPGKGRCLTEDYWFDWLTRESGFATVVDCKIKLKHQDDQSGEIFPEEFPDDPWLLPLETIEP